MQVMERSSYGVGGSVSVLPTPMMGCLDDKAGAVRTGPVSCSLDPQNQNRVWPAFATRGEKCGPAAKRGEGGEGVAHMKQLTYDLGVGRS